jgi:hypothetical protein
VSETTVIVEGIVKPDGTLEVTKKVLVPLVGYK